MLAVSVEPKPEKTLEGVDDSRAGGSGSQREPVTSQGMNRQPDQDAEDAEAPSTS